MAFGGFGVSVGDLIAVGKLAFDVYTACTHTQKVSVTLKLNPEGKYGHKGFEEASHEVFALDVAIRAAKIEAENPESTLPPLDESKQQELKTLLDNCNETLQELQRLTNDYRNADTKFKRLRYSFSGDKRVARLREALGSHTRSINLYLSTHNSKSLAKLQHKVDELVQELRNGRTPMPNLRAAVADANDGAGNKSWSLLEDHLSDRGLTRHDLETYKEHVLAYLHRLVEDGALQIRNGEEGKAPAAVGTEVQLAPAKQVDEDGQSINQAEGVADIEQSTSSSSKPASKPSILGEQKPSYQATSTLHQEQNQQGRKEVPTRTAREDTPFYEEYREQITEYDTQGRPWKRTFRSRASSSASGPSRNSSQSSCGSGRHQSDSLIRLSHDPFSQPKLPTALSSRGRPTKGYMFGDRGGVVLQDKMRSLDRRAQQLSTKEQNLRAEMQKLGDMEEMVSRLRKDIASLESWAALLKHTGEYYKNERDFFRHFISGHKDLHYLSLDRPQSPDIYCCTYASCRLLYFKTKPELSKHLKETHPYLDLHEASQGMAFHCEHICFKTGEACTTSFVGPFDLISHEMSAHAMRPRVVRCRINGGAAHSKMKLEFDDRRGFDDHLKMSHPHIFLMRH